MLLLLQKLPQTELKTLSPVLTTASYCGLLELGTSYASLYRGLRVPASEGIRCREATKRNAKKPKPVITPFFSIPPL